MTTPPRRRAGSSPHTRGAPYPDWQQNYSKRIIPAYAGSTLRAAEDTTKFKDHPRIRGEHSFLLHPSCG